MVRSKRGKEKKKSAVQKRKLTSQKRVLAKKVRKLVKNVAPKRAKTLIKKVKGKKARSTISPRLRVERITEQRIAQPKKEVLIEEEIGKIAHFYTHLNVGVLEIANGMIKAGDKIRIKGETTDFIQTVKSMQWDHKPVERAQAGQSIGLKVDQRVRQHDKVFLIE